MKKKFVLLSILALCFNFTGCNNSENNFPDIHVKFVNYDDTVLYETTVKYGESPVYLGEEPKRESTKETSYVFSGWDIDISNLLFKDTVFTAQYTANVREYFVVFYNYDDSKIWQTTVKYGECAQFNHEYPKRKSDDERIVYEFSGWDKDIDTYKIVEDTSFKATFKSFEIVFATFNNYDGSFLAKEKVKKGNNAVYSGATPAKPYSGTDRGYRFLGWDKPLTNMMNDTTFTAQFALLNLYAVTFQNYDGSILQQSKVLEGENAVYTGKTPYRNSYISGDYITNYSFIGWDYSLENIMRDTTFTAQFSSSTKATGATSVRNHLNAYGSGDFHNVITGTGSALGYSGSYFYVGFYDDDDNNNGLSSVIAINFEYGASYGYSTFQITDEGIKTYEANMRAYVSNHRYQKLELISISVCRYTTDDQLALVAALSILAAQFAIDRATNYLENHNLPYIW